MYADDDVCAYEFFQLALTIASLKCEWGPLASVRHRSIESTWAAEVLIAGGTQVFVKPVQRLFDDLIPQHHVPCVEQYVPFVFFGNS